MAAKFVKIGTGESFRGKLPRSVILPVRENDPITHVVAKRSIIGDVDWEESLKRWMFIRGYCLPEDNEREMNTEKE